MLPRLIPSEKSDPVLYPYRHGLVFGLFNALTWQVAISTPMVLFLQWLGATPFQVGLAYSFVFVLMVAQIVSNTLLPRYGYRRVMLMGWGTRTIFVAVPVLIALLTTDNPAPGGWRVYVMVGSVFFFCLLRALGQAAFAPWIYALMSPEKCGRYFAADQYVSGVGGLVTLVACTLLFWWLPVREALLAAYLIALAGSVGAFYFLRKMPDGPRPAPVGVMKIVRDMPQHVIRPSLYREYLWLSVVFAVIMTPVTAFVPYYLKVVPHMTEGWIMVLEVCRFFGVILAAGLMQTRLDRHGARPYLTGAAFGYIAIAVYWWWALRSGATGLVGLGAVSFLVGGAMTACIAGNLNYLAKITPPADRTLMVTVHSVAIAVAGGLSLIAWGYFLKRGGAVPGISVTAFEWFFVTVFVGAVFLGWRIRRLPESMADKTEPLPSGSAILRPFRTMPLVGGIPGASAKTDVKGTEADASPDDRT